MAIGLRRHNRHFFSSTLALLICFFCARQLLLIAYTEPNWQSLAVKSLSQETKIVFLGSSRFYYGIDPATVAEKSVSLNANYLSASYMLKIYKTYEHQLPNLKAIVFEHSISTYLFDTAHVDPGGLKRLGVDFTPPLAEFFHAPKDSLKRLLFPIFHWRLTPFDIKNYRETLTNGDEIQNQYPGFIPSKLTMNFPAELIPREITKMKDLIQSQPQKTLHRNTAAALELAQIAKDKDIEFFAIVPPRFIDKEYATLAEWDHFLSLQLEKLKETNPHVHVFNARTEVKFGSQKFRDPDHLNASGAYEFSRILKNYLEFEGD